MLATIINVVLVLVGSAVGLLFRGLISQRLMSILTHALGLRVLGIGISNMLSTPEYPVCHRVYGDGGHPGQCHRH